MTNIRDLTEATTISGGDLLPIAQGSSGRTRSVSYSVIKDDVTASVTDEVAIAVAAAEAAEEAAASADATVLRSELADGVTAGDGADLVEYASGVSVRDKLDSLDEFDTDLQNSNDPAKGAAIVGRGVVAVDSIADLLALPAGARRGDLRYEVKGYLSGSGVGGGPFYWDSASEEAVNEVTVFGDSATGRFKRSDADSALQVPVVWAGQAADGNIDDALDRIAAWLSGYLPLPSGRSILFPLSISRIARSHDFAETGARLLGYGGRYASRVIVDPLGDYSAGYVMRVAPSETSTNEGSGLKDLTIDLNEAPATGLIYLGAYDTAILERAEVINAHDDYMAADIGPTATGTVIQTLKLDTCAFSKKNSTATGHTVRLRKTQECMQINSKFFGGPSNLGANGAIPLLLEDVRGFQSIGGGFANSASHLIDIYAKTRTSTHVEIIGPTFESYGDRAIRTRAEPTFFVSRLSVSNERLISPAAGLLEGGALTFSSITNCNGEVDLLSDSSNNHVYSYDASKVTDAGTFNLVVDMPSTLNSNQLRHNRHMMVKMVTTPRYMLGVEGRTGSYIFEWSASAATDNGASIKTPNNSQVIRFSDDRIGFFGTAPITKRAAITGTTEEKIDAVILALQQFGLTN